MQLFHFELRGWVAPADVFTQLYGSDAAAFWLDRENHPSQRFSVVGNAHQGNVVEPAEAFQILTERTNWQNGENLDAGTLPFGFRPGFIGWLNYPDAPTIDDMPSGSLLDVREAIVFDHDARRMHFLGYFVDRERFDHWLNAVFLRLALSGGQQASYRFRNRPKAVAKPVSIRHTKEQYLELIERSQQAIRQGEVYQLCLTNQLTFSHDSDPLEVFLRLRQTNAAPYAAFVRVGQKSLVCSSPEHFLSLDANGTITTKPIKGTRPRSNDPQLDAELALELKTNQKERAENLMIVDLMRNDLVRVSHPDSVQVPDLFQVESYATVHQLVSTVQSKLRPDASMPQLIAAAFPGGSMTGAPKLRAQELISQFEGAPRGIYSGAVGYFATDGSLELGMTIRSLVFDGDTVTLSVGGGITIDSDPEAEFEETRIKAQALLAVLGSPDPWASFGNLES
ncbi:MAG: aminodeoxychorismate synthase component I [Micrococcales bacterium]